MFTFFILQRIHVSFIVVDKFRKYHSKLHETFCRRFKDFKKVGKKFNCWFVISNLMLKRLQIIFSWNHLNAE
jgi:hypothetical protein